MADILRSLPYIVREGLKNVSIYIGKKLLRLKLTLTLSGVNWIGNKYGLMDRYCPEYVFKNVCHLCGTESNIFDPWNESGLFDFSIS